MSRPPASTRAASVMSKSSSVRSNATTAPRSSSRPTTWPKPKSCAIASRSWWAAGSSPTAPRPNSAGRSPAGGPSTPSTWRTCSWSSPGGTWKTTRTRRRPSMTDIRFPAPARRFPVGQQLNLGWAFVERQTNLWKRHWAWEIVWLVYGVVNTLAITFIAKQLTTEGIVSGKQANDLVLFLLLGTLVWAYLSAVLDDISLVVTWERWEGTIEHTLMAPVPRWVHLIGMAVFGVLHATVRTLLIMAIALPFFSVDFGQADWATAAVVMIVGSLSIASLGILAGVLPLLYPERGTQMSFMVQAFVLLVSGVYYSVDVLPPWLRVFSEISPATYILDGIRGALIDGDGVQDLLGTLATLFLCGVILVPGSIAVFAV